MHTQLRNHTESVKPFGVQDFAQMSGIQRVYKVCTNSAMFTISDFSHARQIDSLALNLDSQYPRSTAFKKEEITAFLAQRWPTKL